MKHPNGVLNFQDDVPMKTHAYKDTKSEQMYVQRKCMYLNNIGVH